MLINFKWSPLLMALLTGCCEKKINDQPDGGNEDDPTGFSFTVVSGELPDPPERFFEVSKEIYRLIKDEPNPDFERYTETVPRSNNATFDLIPIQGGEFVMGSEAREVDAQPDEMPAHRVVLDSFWMASTETTWALYQSFVFQETKDGSSIGRDEYGFPLELHSDSPIDIISGPSVPYAPHQFRPLTLADQKRVKFPPDHLDSKDYQMPAIGMSRHAALKFCQWLTAQTGHFYRLPTEAEWEYACRAGTRTRYSFGNEESALAEYGFFKVEEEKRSEIPWHRRSASFKPNPWGLYDMHGNVMEWTLDAYSSDYQEFPDGVKNPITFSENLHAGVARGGAFHSAASELRSAKRFPASRSWNHSDPRNPPSIWYNTDAFWLGFRVVRPLRKPSLEEAHLIWNIDSGKFWNW